jgi:acetoacetyl-CoA synthetase
MKTCLWEPSQELIKEANLTAFIHEVIRKHKAPISTYNDLYNWSVKQPEHFWDSVWKYSGIISHAPYSKVLENHDDMLKAEWFSGAKLNFAENLLRFRDNNVAILFRSEDGRGVEITYSELYNKVSAISQYLKSAGVKPGDRVVGFLPNIPETVIAMLATTSIGAIWSSCSPDFGLQGILDRFGQIAPKIIFCVDGYVYNGKKIDLTSRINDMVSKIASIERVVLVKYLSTCSQITFPKETNDFLEIEAEYSTGQEIEFYEAPFNHPIYIMYSSGTTGVPKCIVHGAGGTLIQHAKELILHTDLKREDTIFYFTTCGWMMWNWLVSSLFVGSTILLYEGAPLYPDGNVLFDIASTEMISVFGTSAKYISALEKAGIEPKSSHDLSKLRTILSTGSPLAPESFDFVYNKVKSDVCLSSISGGTDIISCFGLGNPIRPVYRGEIQTRGLGMDVRVFNEQGQEVVGEKGELVCASPFPSMPVYFWDDVDGVKYFQSYFNVYPNVWRHGDYCKLTDNNGLIIYGRSDAVLNPGGVRIGTAEIYAQVEQLDEILESIAVGQSWKGDERVVLFVKLKEGIELNKLFVEKIKHQIRTNLTPRHVPAKIIKVSDIPRTISGKITEIAVRNIIHGMPVKNKDALANPDALECFRNIRELNED